MCNVLTVLRWVSKYKVFSRILQSLWVKLSPFSTDTFPLKQKADRIKHNLFTPIHIFFSLPQPPLLSRELIYATRYCVRYYVWVHHNYYHFCSDILQKNTYMTTSRIVTINLSMLFFLNFLSQFFVCKSYRIMNRYLLII